MDLVHIAKEIREIISEKQKELGLSFIEEDHIYHMNGKTDYPSVTSVIKKYYKGFDSIGIANKKANGNEEKAKELIDKWEGIANYATNLGSRVHYFLEKKLIGNYGNYKNVREPIFECDKTQIKISDKMINSGYEYLKLMEERGAVLLDTEMVLGHPDLGYTGQPDKVWLIPNKDKTDFGIIITDWKTNKDESFEVNNFTTKMYKPFDKYHSTSLEHYYVQLPLYGKLLLKMLSESKYGAIKIYGYIICHLKKNGEYKEFRVPREVSDIVFNMDI